MLHFLVPFIILTYVLPQPEDNATLETSEVVPGVTRFDNYEAADGYYLFVPTDSKADSLNTVVFVHGFGAINPVAYGSWIEHLVKQGNAVIYVRYQEGLFSTSTTEFVPNTATAVNNAILHATSEGFTLRSKSIDLIGHSYGGVISANIAVNWQSLGVPEPGVVLLCEPGSGPLTGGLLETYEGMSPDLLLAIVVGDDDHTVGQSLGQKVMETSTNTPNRVLFWQYADENGEEEIEASHYEPYSYDSRFDNGISNFTVNRSEKVSDLNAVDSLGYWQIYDQLSSLKQSGLQTYSEELLLELASLGTYKDGTAIKPMEIHKPQKKW